jgi:predicted O-methyltransferase YrrM
MDYLSRIIPAEGMWLYQLCREVKPQNTLEIGLGYGFSTVYILAALSANGVGHHTAIDPFQLHANKQWRGIGLQHARELGAEARFTFFLDRSVPVLVDFAKQERQFEVIFIDGGHLFDEAFLDFTLSAVLCPPGGYIVLDDTWMPAIHRVIEFIRTNRLDFAPVKSLVENISVFRRTGNDTRDWNHFAEFARW